MYAFRATEVSREHVPLSVAVSPTGPDGFELTVAPSQTGTKPAVDGPVEVTSPWSVPGPLWVHSGDDRHRLERLDTVLRDPMGNHTRPVEDAESIPIPSDEELAATYRVPPEVPAGTYQAWGLVHAAWVAAESGRPSPTWPFPFQVAMTVPDR